jgi:TPR repeat protein
MRGKNFMQKLALIMMVCTVLTAYGSGRESELKGMSDGQQDVPTSQRPVSPKGASDEQVATTAAESESIPQAKLEVNLEEHFPANFLTLLRAFKNVSTNHVPFFEAVETYKEEGISHLLEGLALKQLGHPEFEWRKSVKNAFELSRRKALSQRYSYDALTYALSLHLLGGTDRSVVLKFLNQAVETGCLGLLAFGRYFRMPQLPENEMISLVYKTLKKLEADKGTQAAHAIVDAMEMESPLNLSDEFMALTCSFKGLDSLCALEAGYAVQYGYYLFNRNNAHVRAFAFANIAFSRGHVRGLALLGNCFMDGFGVKKDEKKAISLYQQAIDQGFAAGFNSLAWAFFNGRGVEQNKARAFELYSKAAEQGYKGGMVNLAWAFLHGEGVAKDPVLAVEWYKKAAEKGDIDAMLSLGKLYLNGQAVKQQLEEGAYWIKKAAELGSLDAMNYLGWCYDQGKGVDQNYVEAAKWFTRAAYCSHIHAMTNIASYYAYGTGVEKNLEESAKWYKQAAEQGSIDAMVIIGGYFAEGTGVKKDPQAAFGWYEKAADLGNTDGMIRLGESYETGTGVKKNLKTACGFYKKAADKDDAFAYVKLGWCYEHGSGIEQDQDYALRLYQEASKRGSEQGKKQSARIETERMTQQLVATMREMIPASAVRSAASAAQVVKSSRSDSAGAAAAAETPAVSAKAPSVSAQAQPARRDRSPKPATAGQHSEIAKQAMKTAAEAAKEGVEAGTETLAATAIQELTEVKAQVPPVERSVEQKGTQNLEADSAEKAQESS